MHSKQETFDIVARHLLTQMKQSIVCDEEELEELGVFHLAICCVYRTSDGLKCAAGCLIPDDKYTPAMEGKLAPDVVEGELEFFGHDTAFVKCLQLIHDGYEPHNWKWELAYLAARENLDPHVLQEF